MKIVLKLFLFFFITAPVFAQKQITKLVLLGTGTPITNAERSGPSLAIVVNNASYIVDCGPGVVRRAGAASEKEIEALQTKNLKRLFITHLHSDHTIGYPDIIFSPAVLHRKEALEVYGPIGLQNMTNHIMQAYQEDMNMRIHGLEKGEPEGYQVNVHEVDSGIIYKDSNIIVTAFQVKHGTWKSALGYKFTTADKTIVVSGDCTYSEELIKQAENCDILVHEVYSEKGLSTKTDDDKAYFPAFHTSTSQLATIANKAKPKLLVLTHQLPLGQPMQNLIDEISVTYKGAIVNGKDLGVY